MLARPQQLVLDELEARLSRCPGTMMKRSSTGLAVAGSGPNGFDMALIASEGQYLVAFDGWEETFDDVSNASKLLEDAVNGLARLRIDTLGGKSWRWTLERLDANGRWVPHSTVGQPVWRFWGKAKVHYLHNEFQAAHTSVPASGIR
ncbi:MAG: hypothetical protein SFW09_08500 [Hyphomicrobiaceae bacterium]|nr:hypothetical protein [Hyphomicrobiaceae bacterium]